jgi:GTP-binding protein EngB required for normal cell division
VWLLDSRREPSAEDDGMQELLARRGTHVLAALTKGDKLPRGQRLQREAAIRDVLALDPDQIMMTSAKTGDGIPELKEAIMNLIVKREA